MSRGKLKSRTRLTYSVSFEVAGARPNKTTFANSVRDAVVNGVTGSGMIIPESIRIQWQKSVVTSEREF